MKTLRFRQALIGVLWCGAAGLSGCNLGGWLGYVAAGDQVPPVYKPEDKLTLILVDQAPVASGVALGDPDKSGVVAAQIAFELRQKNVVTKIVDPAALAELRKKTGDGFDKLSAADVARRLGAQQTIQVRVLNATLQGEYNEIGNVRVYRPVADVQVRTFDVATGKCLFPGPEFNDVMHVIRPPGEDQPSYLMTVTLSHQATPDDRRDPMPALRQELAERIGRDVARLFCGYDKAQPGERQAPGIEEQ